MKYLLDTHAIIWYYENSSKLPKKIEELIDNPSASIYICSASLWEIAIKTKTAEDLAIITIDENIKKYNVAWIW